MIISNVSIAERIAQRGYDMKDALTSVDAVRTQDEERKGITLEAVNELVDSICDGLDEEAEFKSGNMW